MPRIVSVPNLADFIRRYEAGESLYKLAGEAGISRCALQRKFERNGVSIRDRSSAMTQLWSGMSEQERIEQTRAAWDATRGTTAPLDRLTKAAQTKETNGTGITPVMEEFSETLRGLGLSVTLKKAAGIYNVDVALSLPAIAVEILSRSGNAYGRHRDRLLKKAEYLLDEGWAVVIVWINSLHHPLGIGAAQHLLSLSQRLGRNPTGGREYEVIWGDGEPAPTSGSYFNNRTIVERLCRSDDLAGSDNHLAG